MTRPGAPVDPFAPPFASDLIKDFIKDLIKDEVATDQAHRCQGRRHQYGRQRDIQGRQPALLHALREGERECLALLLCILYNFLKPIKNKLTEI